jgi:hypothetical protein
MMKRKWRGMSIKRKKNPNEVQHVETSLSFLSLDEGEVFQTFLPPTHEYEEMISLNVLGLILKCGHKSISLDPFGSRTKQDRIIHFP